jgi:hypothetical protein
MKKIGLVICLMLMFSMTSSIVIGQGQNIDKKTIIIYENNPPSTPKISAPDTAIKNRIFLTKTISTDPDGDKIFYRFKIGEDGTPHSWDGPFYSGYEFKFRIGILGYTGDLIFGFQSKDEHGAQSDWSYHTTTYINSRDYNIIGNSFLTFIGRIFQLINK